MDLHWFPNICLVHILSLFPQSCYFGGGAEWEVGRGGPLLKMISAEEVES